MPSSPRPIAIRGMSQASGHGGGSRTTKPASSGASNVGPRRVQNLGDSTQVSTRGATKTYYGDGENSGNARKQQSTRSGSSDVGARRVKNLGDSTQVSTRGATKTYYGDGENSGNARKQRSTRGKKK